VSAVAELAYLALVSSDPAHCCEVLQRDLGLARNELSCAGVPVPVFSAGKIGLAVVAPGHPLAGDAARPGVHHAALAAQDLDAAAERFRAAGIAPEGGTQALGLDGRRVVRLAPGSTLGVRIVLTEPLRLAPHAGGTVERIDHVGIASTDPGEDEALFAGRLGYPVESRQTDMEVIAALESFTSDKYGVLYHARKPEPVGGLRVCFVTVGECEFEFLANFDPNQGGAVEHGRAGSTRQDQGAIARFVASRGRGLHHVALKTPDIDAVLSKMAAAGRPMIDTRGRPGSRRALIGFPHPKALGGVLIHFVERPG
jgi:methylmalonyl-CoA/ethylmalonyl-CoA epimerase